MRIVLFLITCFACVLAAQPAMAHPHAWISVRTTIILNDKNEAVAIREHWLFDKMYSAFAARDLDPKGDGKFKTDDLQPLAQQNLDNLAAFHYFTVFEKAPQDQVKLGKPEKLVSTFEEAPPTEKKKVIVYASPPAATLIKSPTTPSKSRWSSPCRWQRPSTSPPARSPIASLTRLTMSI